METLLLYLLNIISGGMAFGYMPALLYEPKPCQIIFSRHGCCWDGRTIPTGPNGQGCPACRDRKRRFCRSQKLNCDSDDLVKRICPFTCQKCTKQEKVPRINYLCRDENHMEKQCHLYHLLDLCYLASIKTRCRKSCGTCFPE